VGDVIPIAVGEGVVEVAGLSASSQVRLLSHSTMGSMTCCST
jgi:hypothetical protein